LQFQSFADPTNQFTYGKQRARQSCSVKNLRCGDMKLEIEKSLL
jgi:hypothetical protein